MYCALKLNTDDEMIFGKQFPGLAQLIEPSLNVLGREAESLSNGRFTKFTLVRTVAFGVAFGSVVGVFKVVTFSLLSLSACR